MATDLDYDDPIGQRLRELRAPDVDGAPDAAWSGVEQHRKARRTRHVVAALGTAAIALVVVIGVFAVTQSDDGGNHVEVVTPSSVAPTTIAEATDPPIFEVLPIAITTQLSVAQTGPIPAGTEIEIVLTQVPHKVQDTINTQMQVCFPWGTGETCDPTLYVNYVDTNNAGITTYRVKMPGWVRTAGGLRSCQVIGCRIAMPADDGTRIGTPTLDVVSDVAPDTNTELVRAGTDGVVRFTMDGMEPDESWTRYATSLNLPPGAKPGLESGWTSICALTYRLLCDGVVRAKPPVLDGQARTVDVETNRLVLTPEGWIDCVEFTCVIVINRTIDVSQGPGGSTGSSQEVIGIVPYRLPADTPVMAKPVMTLTPAEDLHNQDVVTVTIRNLPGNVDPIKWRELGGIGQCAAEDLRLVDDCTFSTKTTFTELPDNGLRVEYPVRTCYKGPPCYIALSVGGKGYPELARTEAFPVDP